jgi:hypothetical protein
MYAFCFAKILLIFFSVPFQRTPDIRQPSDSDDSAVALEQLGGVGGEPEDQEAVNGNEDFYSELIKGLH